MGINENNLITCVKKEGKLSRLQLSDISLQRRSHHKKLFWQGSSQRHRQGSQRHCFNPFEVFFYNIGATPSAWDRQWQKLGNSLITRVLETTSCQQTEIDLI